MSVKAMGWAYDQRVGDPVRKAVLIALANIADEEGYCWPSIRRIAWMAETSTRTAQRAVQDLELGGFLLIERDRKRDNGAKTSNGYRMPIEARQLPFDVTPDAYDSVTHPPRVTGAHLSRGQGAGVTGVTCTEPLFEPSLEPSIADGLPAWWPREAWKAFEKLRKAKRLPITAKARELLVKKITALRASGHKPADVLNQSVEMGWTSVYPIKGERARTSTPADRSRVAEEATRLIEGAS